MSPYGYKGNPKNDYYTWNFKFQCDCSEIGAIKLINILEKCMNNQNIAYKYLHASK